MSPLTGPESNGEWTTLAQEAAFLSELSTYPRVTVTDLEPSPLGRPIRLVQVGYEGNPSVFVAAPHGDEPAGREGILQWVRDLATSTDIDIVDYLNHFTVYAIPTCNPDGIVRNSRLSGDWIDINRDHLSLEAVETRNIARVRQLHHPQLVLDLHDDVNEETYDTRTIGTQNELVAPGIREVSQALNAFVQQDLTDLGYLVTDYPSAFFPSMNSSVSGFRHSIPIVSEVRHLPPAERARLQVATMEAARKFQVAHQPEIIAAIRESKASQRTAGATPSPVDVGDHDEILITPDSAYYLTRAQVDQLKTQIELFGLRVEYDDSGGTIPSAQAMYPVIALTVDAGSPHRVITDTAAPPTPPFVPDGYLLKVSGVHVVPDRVAMRVGGSMSTIWEPPGV